MGAVTAARIEHILVGGEPAAWERLGMRVVDDTIWLYGASVRFVDAEPGVRGWTMSGLDAAAGDRFDIDGLDTLAVAPATPTWVDHPLGVIEIDHVVVTTDDLERTSSAIEAATASPCRRIRETDVVRQGFHRLGNVIVEVVEPRHADSGSSGGAEAHDGAAFFGLAFNLEDIDRVSEYDDDLIGAPKAAVQPGRQIATVRRDAGLGPPVAFMSMPVR
jgi:hypothetical protein